MLLKRSDETAQLQPQQAPKEESWGTSAGKWLGSKLGTNSVLGGTDLKENLGKATQKQVNKDPAAFGKNMVNMSGGSAGTSTSTPSGSIANDIGKAISEKLPSSPKIGVIPRMMLGFAQGGFGGGISNMGSVIGERLSGMFSGGKEKTAAGADNHPLDKMPMDVAKRVGSAFKGSPAAQGAADQVAPMVEKGIGETMGGVIGKDAWGLISNPMGYIQDAMKNFSSGGEKKTEVPGTSTTTPSADPMGDRSTG